MTQALILVGVGLVGLIVASDRLVVSAVRVSSLLGVSPILIGAIVVGLGTSLPELLVSAIAASRNELEVSMANVVGSNVANLTLVLGFASLIKPVVSKTRVLRREGMLMFVALIALTGVLIDDRIARTEGAGLLVGLGIALVLLVMWSSGPNADDADEEETEEFARGAGFELGMGAFALVATVVAANLLLQGAIDIGEMLGWSDVFLGVLLGIGTSLPEMATAAASARRGESDLVVGNVIGSNIFNSLAVAGTAATVGPTALGSSQVVQVGVMLGVAALAGGFMRTGDEISRLEGMTLLAIFATFTFLSF